MYENRSDALIALGGNLPFQGEPPSVTLRQAVNALAHEDVVIRAVSRFFSTPCFPAGAGPDYVNAAVLITTSLAPKGLLDRLHAVEAAFHRARTQRWGERTVDLDLLTFGQTILPDVNTHEHWRALPAEQQIAQTPDRLILPHPRLQDRAFVLVPMADIAPDWVHPTLQKTVAELCRALPAGDTAQVRAI